MNHAEDATAALVIVGNEVLSAKVTDENTPFLLARLRALGVVTRSVRVVPDEAPLMIAAYRAACAAHTWVFSTGGVGPTHDDITMDAAAAAFGQVTAPRTELANLLKEVLGDRLTAAHLKMARVPEGAELVWEEGLRFPVVRLENLFIFPGAPGLLRKKFLAIEHRFRQRPIHLARLYLQGDEAEIAGLLERAEAGAADVQIGSYPVWGLGDHDIQVTFEGRDLTELRRVFAGVTAGLPAGYLVRKDEA